MDRSKFKNIKELKGYERLWHYSIFQPALAELPKLYLEVSIITLIKT